MWRGNRVSYKIPIFRLPHNTLYRIQEGKFIKIPKIKTTKRIHKLMLSDLFTLCQSSALH